MLRALATKMVMIAAMAVLSKSQNTDRPPIDLSFEMSLIDVMLDMILKNKSGITMAWMSLVKILPNTLTYCVCSLNSIPTMSPKNKASIVLNPKLFPFFFR